MNKNILVDAQRKLSGTVDVDPDIPDGFTDEHDSSIWNVGHVFTWSAVEKRYICLAHSITVKPDETPAEAYHRRPYDRPIDNAHVFFIADRKPSDWRTRQA